MMYKIYNDSNTLQPNMQTNDVLKKKHIYQTISILWVNSSSSDFFCCT